MSKDTLAQLVQRLESTELELAATQLQVRALQAMPRARSRRDAIVVLLGLVLLFTMTRALSTYAQGGGAQVLTVKAPFRVVDANNKVLMKVEAISGTADMTIGDPASGGVTLGVGKSGSGYVSTRTSVGQDGVNIGQYRGAGMGVYLVGPDGQTLEGGLYLGSKNKGHLLVGDVKGGGISAGPGDSGTGYLVVRTAVGKTGIDMGELNGRPMSVGVFGTSGQELVSLKTDEKGGSVEVMNPTGVGLVSLRTDPTGGSVLVSNPKGMGVGALLARESGGRIALTGPAGGKTAVGLSVEASGGKVRVFPQEGGSAQAELTAEATGGGAVTVYTTAGEAVGMLQATSAGAGKLGDRQGQADLRRSRGAPQRRRHRPRGAAGRQSPRGSGNRDGHHGEEGALTASGGIIKDLNALS